MASPVNNNNSSIPDSLTSWDGTDIDPANMGYLMDEAAFTGMANGISGSSDDSESGLTLGDPSQNTDTYNIGVSNPTTNVSSPYNPTDNPDFYNIGVTDTTPDTPLAQAQINQEKEQAWSNARRASNGIKI